MIRPKGFFSLDIDGAIVPNTFVNGIKRPMNVLIHFVQSARRAGYHIVFNTGQTYEVANQFREFFGIEDAWVMVEMGNILHKNCVGETVLQGKELTTFMAKREKLAIKMKKNGGIIQDTKLMLIGEYHSIDKLHSAADEIPSCPIVKIYPVEIDVRLNAIPQKTNKGSITNYIDAPMVIAAGDSSSDIAMLEKAIFPIATHETGEVNPKLVELINKKGQGYIAKPDELAGLGLYQGLLAAKRAGIISL